MLGFIVYSCQCFNIRIHLSTKYTNDNFDELKTESVVKAPVSGWEFDLGLGGIVIEFNSLIESTSHKSGWKTIGCFNCNCGEVYSVAEQNSSIPGRVVIHENAIFGQQVEDLKYNKNYSQIFNIKLNENNVENLIPMPNLEEDIPNKLLANARQQIQSIVDQSIEKIRIESKSRIEEFKRQEEQKTQELISHAKLENNQLWSKIVQVVKEKEDKHIDEKKERNHSHVRFVPFTNKDENQESEIPSVRKLSFALDEAAISSSLKNKNLDYYKLQNEGNLLDDENEDEEDMFNLDEEFSEEEKEDEGEEVEAVEKENDNSVDIPTNDDSVDTPTNNGKVKNYDQLLSSSLKKSITESDQKFSWIKKRRNTSKYLTQDFDIKNDLKRYSNKSDEDISAVSMFATSVPITIHYPAAEEEKKDDSSNNDGIPKKDILASSFANYDFSYSDRMLSEQFPAPLRKKSVASSSLIRPQLDSFIGKSLDTRGLMKKKVNEIEPKDNEDYDGFDSSLPPHVWAAMKSFKDEPPIWSAMESIKDEFEEEE